MIVWGARFLLAKLDQTEHTVSVVLFQNEFYLFIYFVCCCFFFFILTREKKKKREKTFIMRNSWAEFSTLISPLPPLLLHTHTQHTDYYCTYYHYSVWLKMFRQLLRVFHPSHKCCSVSPASVSLLWLEADRILGDFFYFYIVVVCVCRSNGVECPGGGVEPLRMGLAQRRGSDLSNRRRLPHPFQLKEEGNG